MSGIVLGGGALIFKEVTEGLGCLLGGFCLSMWFLTLKSGGLITTIGGKAIFIAAFCVVSWSFSFSHYTRAYGLIGSTSFSGATAFVLGIDCFSRSGLKEFWVYIWDLNDDLFPLGTSTYPITRGTRVETVIIILGTIIGVISQIKLWKVVQKRHEHRAVVQLEDERRRDAVEEELGRQLERLNDRDRLEWEKRYGDRLGSRRDTVLWSEVHGENKMYPSTSTTELGSSQNSVSTESLEMMTIAPTVAKIPLHNSKSKRQSNVSVQPIQELEEDEDKAHEKQSRNRDLVVGNNQPRESMPQSTAERLSFDHDAASASEAEHNDLTRNSSKESQAQLDVPSTLKPSFTRPSTDKTAARLQSDKDEVRAKKRSSIPSLKDLRRRSLQSLASKSSTDGEKSTGMSDFSESKEALVMPSPSLHTQSRASSMAATLDDENEKLDMPAFDIGELRRDNRPPQIVISPVDCMSFEDQIRSELQGPPSPSGLSDKFGSDPEELVRPPTAKAHGILDFEIGSGSKRTSDGLTNVVVEEVPKSSTGTNQTSSVEGLTKGALDKVPSQMSDVVLSYRTNEWAKHIATAEAPIFEEPDSISVQDIEPSTRLTDPVVSTPGYSTPESNVIEKLLPQPSPIASVAPSEAGTKVNSEIQLIVPNRPEPTTAPTSNPSRILSQFSNANQRSFTDPALRQQQQQFSPLSALPKAARRTSNPVQRQPSILQSTTIDENSASDFTHRPNVPKRSSATPRQNYTPGSSQIDLTRSGTSGQAGSYPSAFKRSSSFNIHQNLPQPDTRPTTAHSPSPYTTSNNTAIHSETRLLDYGSKSHQPLQRNNTNGSRRESLMTDWRMDLPQSRASTIAAKSGVEKRYTQQMLDYEADKLRKEQEKHHRQRRESVKDQNMRSQGMIDAHREVLKRMQSQANKKLSTKS